MPLVDDVGAGTSGAIEAGRSANEAFGAAVLPPRGPPLLGPRRLPLPEPAVGAGGGSAVAMTAVWENSMAVWEAVLKVSVRGGMFVWIANASKLKFAWYSLSGCALKIWRLRIEKKTSNANRQS